MQSISRNRGFVTPQILVSLALWATLIGSIVTTMYLKKLYNVANVLVSQTADFGHIYGKYALLHEGGSMYIENGTADGCNLVDSFFKYSNATSFDGASMTNNYTSTPYVVELAPGAAGNERNPNYAYPTRCKKNGSQSYLPPTTINHNLYGFEPCVFVTKDANNTMQALLFYVSESENAVIPRKITAITMKKMKGTIGYYNADKNDIWMVSENNPWTPLNFDKNNQNYTCKKHIVQNSPILNLNMTEYFNNVLNENQALQKTDDPYHSSDSKNNANTLTGTLNINTTDKNKIVLDQKTGLAISNPKDDIVSINGDVIISGTMQSLKKVKPNTICSQDEVGGFAMEDDPDGVAIGRRVSNAICTYAPLTCRAYAPNGADLSKYNYCWISRFPANITYTATTHPSLPNPFYCPSAAPSLINATVSVGSSMQYLSASYNGTTLQRGVQATGSDPKILTANCTSKITYILPYQ